MSEDAIEKILAKYSPPLTAEQVHQISREVFDCFQLQQSQAPKKPSK